MKIDDKSKGKKRALGEKTSTTNLRRAYLILLYLRDGNYFPTQIASRLKKSRESTQYWINKLVADGLCYCTNPQSNKYMQYKITPAGENFIAMNESTVPKDKQIEVQNGRFKCYIRKQDNFLKFIKYPEYNFKNKPPNTELKNCIVYHGNILGTTATIIHGSVNIDKVTVILTAPSFHAKTAKEGHYLMFKAMLGVQEYLDKKWDLDLSRLDLDSEHVEYGFESPWAKSWLKNYGPLKTGDIAVNKSPPSFLPKEEYHDENEADKHLMVPDNIERLRLQVSELAASRDEMLYKLDKTTETLSTLTQTIIEVIQINKDTNNSVTNLGLKLTDLVNTISVKNQSEQSKIEQKDFPLNDQTKSIYG